MKNWKTWQIILFTAICVCLNVGGKLLATWLELPLWADSFGTALCAYIAGPICGAMVGLAGKYKANVKKLSGGEQQRVALARALVNKPAILLADEPTGNLDPNNAWDIMDLLAEINEQGTTVVVVTHSPTIVNAMKKRVVAMKLGEVISDEQEGEYVNED